MKISTQITAALVAMGIVSQAMATDPVVYLTGSTAFRSTIFKSLSDTSGTTNSVFMPGFSYGTWGNSSAGSANYMVFHGVLTNAGAYNGQSVYIDCAWSGSEAGIGSVCDATLQNELRDGTYTNLLGSPETWVDYASATLAPAASGGNVVTSAPGPNGTLTNGAQLEANSHQGDLAQADTSQTVSFTPQTTNVLTQLTPYGTEGVVTFTISKNVQPNPSQSWNDCSNVTLPQLNILFANGVAPAWFFTGNTNDHQYVYLVGRNFGSGTRQNMLSDSGYGGHRPVDQNSIGYGIDPRDPAQDPKTLLLQDEGNNGYESGGGVAKALADSGGSTIQGSCQQTDPINGGTGWFALGYLSPSDALSTGNNGGQGLYPNTNNWVTVDGVFSSNGTIENGQWWYWGHEYLYGKHGINGIQAAVGTDLFNATVSQLLSLGYGTDPNGHDAGIPYGRMKVTKASDTAFPAF